MPRDPCSSTGLNVGRPVNGPAMAAVSAALAMDQALMVRTRQLQPGSPGFCRRPDVYVGLAVGFPFVCRPVYGPSPNRASAHRFVTTGWLKPGREAP